MLNNTGLHAATANQVNSGNVGEFTIAGVTADDSFTVIEKKMRLYKFNQYEQSPAKSLSNQYAMCIDALCTGFFPKAA